jgi:hypothetical protein
MSVSTLIKNQIKSKIAACASVQVTYGHEEMNPQGFPAVMLTAGNMEGEFSSNSENSRIYSYRSLILFPIGQDFIPPASANRLEYAETTIATVIDEIIDAMDTDFELDGAPVLYVNASDVQWGYVAYEGGEARSAEITLRVYTEKTVI